ncbi:MAG: hypothetical protein LUI01_03470 [Firmicutes bacterium]|nr:hypothetical protein [Bacillota bacterium]
MIRQKSADFCPFLWKSRIKFDSGGTAAAVRDFSGAVDKLLGVNMICRLFST